MVGPRAGLLLVAWLTVGASAGAGGEAVRVDRYGDPLPEGAIARLGTARWRRIQSDFAPVTLSPDGMQVVFHGVGGLRAWDTTTGKPLGWLRPEPAIAAAQFTPDGKTLLTASVQSAPRPPDFARTRWLIQHRVVGSGKVLRQVEVFNAPGFPNFPQFSRDGKFFLCNQRQNVPAVWDTLTGKCYGRVEQPMTYWDPLALAPGGTTLALAGEDGHLYLYQMPAGRLLHKLPRADGVPAHSYYAPAFSPDGKMLIVSGPKTLFVWDVATGKLRRGIKDCRGPVAFTTDGKYLACGTPKAIHLFDTATFAEVRRFPHPYDHILTLRFSADGKRLLSAHNSMIGLWDVASGKQLNAAEGHSLTVASLAFSPDGKRLVSGGVTRALVWDLASGRPRQQLPGHSFGVTSLAFAPDGKLLATVDGHASYIFAGNVARVRFWDLATGKLVRQFPAHLTGIWNLAFAPDGKTLATAGHDARFRVWDVATGRRRFQRRGPHSHLKSITYSPDGKALLNVGTKGELSLWRADTGEHIRDLGPNGDEGRVVKFGAFLPGGRAVLSLEEIGPGRSEWRFWDVGTGKRLRSSLGPQMGWTPRELALAPDGKTVAVVEVKIRDRAVSLWDVELGKRLVTLRGHADTVTTVAFAPDGKVLATGSGDTTVLLWDVARVRLEGVLTQLGETKPVARRLATDPGRAVALVKQRLQRAAAVGGRVRQLLTDLDADDFSVREKATAELSRLGPEAEPTLRQALESKPSVEVRTRVQAVLDKLGKSAAGYGPERVRLAVRLLEILDSRESWQALRELAKGDDNCVVTRLAHEAVARHKKR